MFDSSCPAGCDHLSDRLWTRYKKTGDDAARNRLIECYLHIVRYHAERVHRRLPSQIDIDDLVSAGVFGLMDAIDSYDVKRGVKFETFCARRVTGAILDELRSLDWAPRLVRSRTTRVQKMRRRLEQKYGRAPTDDELAVVLKVNGEEFERLRRDARRVSVSSLSRNRFHSDSDREMQEIEFIEDRTQLDPLSAAVREDIKQLLIRYFSRAERLVIVLYYYERMTMKQIGATLDMSESRVSQLHSSIVARLKARGRGGLAAALTD